jgi:molybdopterin converting factor small subunit
LAWGCQRRRGMAVKVLAEFIGPVRELAGRSYLVLELSRRADLAEALETLVRIMGDERGRQLVEMLSDGKAFILVNGIAPPSLDVELNNMDKIYIFPAAFGG